MKNKLLAFTPLGVLMVFIITNPSVKDFKDHLGKVSYKGLERDRNYFLYSTYIDKSEGINVTSYNVYTALLGNFWISKQIDNPINVFTIEKERTEEVSDSIRKAVYWQRLVDSVNIKRSQWQAPAKDTKVKISKYDIILKP